MFDSCASCGTSFSRSQLPWQLEVHIRAERWRDTRWRSCRCLPELRCQRHPSLQRQRQRQQQWHCQVQGKDSHRNVTGCVALIRILSLAQDTYNPGLRNSPCWWRLSELGGGQVGWGGGGCMAWRSLQRCCGMRLWLSVCVLGENDNACVLQGWFPKVIPVQRAMEVSESD